MQRGVPVSCGRAQIVSDRVSVAMSDAAIRGILYVIRVLDVASWWQSSGAAVSGGERTERISATVSIDDSGERGHRR